MWPSTESRKTEAARDALVCPIGNPRAIAADNPEGNPEEHLCGELSFRGSRSFDDEGNYELARKEDVIIN